MKISHRFTSIIVISLISITGFTTALMKPDFSFAQSLAHLNSDDDAAKQRQEKLAKTSSAATTEAASSEAFNQFLAVQVGTNGRFNMGAFPSTSGGAGANSYDLIYAWPSSPSTSFTTLRIDGSNQVYGSSGTQIEAPTDIDAKTNRSKWQIGDIEVTQTLQIVNNPLSGREDIARIAYTVRNTGTASHSVGQRMMLDTEINNNDGAPYRVPGAGILTTETEFLGAAIPDNFQAFFSVSDSQRVTAAILKSNGATAPDRLVFARWSPIFNSPYDYSITPGSSFTSDSAYALYWNPSPLNAGESRTYTTFYGLANLNVDLTPPLALSVSGPQQLTINNIQYSPNPFDIVSTILNTGTIAANNIQISLTLPTGLTLDSGTLTQTFSTLAAGREQQVSWRVRALPQTTTQTLEYAVQVGATDVPNKTVTRQITIPGLTTPPTGTCDAYGLNNPANSATGETPGSIANADFNGDGRPDLVTANYEANTISVMLNNGSGGFLPPVTYPVGLNPRFVTTTDLNGDLKTDLVVANLVGGSVSILLGNGAGGFTAAPTVSGMSYPTAVAIGDLNGDGKADLIVANSGSYLTTVVFGNGDGTFTFGFEFFKHEGGMPTAVVIDDFDKDGRLDFAVAYNNTNRAIVYFNRPGSYIDDARILDAGDQPFAMVKGDFNGDGYADLAVANYASNDVTYLTNTRTANFTRTSSAVGRFPRSLAVADLNGDRIDDLFVANEGTNFVTTLTSQTAGAPLRKDHLGSESPSALTVGNFNGDGIPDVIVADYWVNRVTSLTGSCGATPALEAEAPAFITLRYVRPKFPNAPESRNSSGRRGSLNRSR